MEPNLYEETPGHRFQRKFLPEDTYADALEAFVLVCTDAAIIDRSNKTFFLAKRKVDPMPHWWFIGGRVFAGEPQKESMNRCFKRETTLDIPLERFVFTHMRRHFFSTRKQPPKEKGTDSLCYSFVVELTKEERAVATTALDTEEYETGLGLVEFNREKLVAEKVDQSVIDTYDLVFPSVL